MNYGSTVALADTFCHSFSFLFAAAFTCAEKKRLSLQHGAGGTFRRSFRIKLNFVLAEAVLIVLATVTMFRKIYGLSVVMEWAIAFIFVLYQWSLAIDFLAVPRCKDKTATLEMSASIWDGEIDPLVAPNRVHAQDRSRTKRVQFVVQ